MRPLLVLLAAALLFASPATAQEKPFLGVSIAQGHSALRGQGVLVTSVHPGTSAARAGLRPGDVLLRFGDVAIADSARLVAAIEARALGETVTIVVKRDGEELRIECELAARPADTDASIRVSIPDPLNRETLEAQFRVAERAYLTRDFDRLETEGETLAAQVSFFLTTGLAGLDEGEAETQSSEAMHQRLRIRWYRELAKAGISVPINVYGGAIAAGSTLDERIARLIAQLADEDFQKREDATKALRAIGEKARPQLEAAAKSDDMEVQWRARMVLEQLSGQVLPARRPPADYRPVAVSVTEARDGVVRFAVETGDTLQSAGPLHVVVVRDGKEHATIWIKDVELGSCRIHSQGEDASDLESGDRLLWIFKIQAQE